MKREHIRIRATSSNSGNTYMLDLIVDESKVPLTRVPFFGLAGRWKQGGENYPFVLYQDGIMDFGAGWDEDSRYYKTNIREKAIIVGEYFTIDDGEEDTYRVEWLRTADTIDQT
jgi:hypothetical protein